MLGGLALKWKWRARRSAAGKSADRPNLVCGPVQVCWKKFARYFDVELREVPLRAGASGAAPEDMRAACDENTIGVVATLGITYTGAYEPVAEIGAALDSLERERGVDVPIHVDAASGGFIAPFIQPELEWDFRAPRVKSINTSGHKYGLAPLGVGWVIWRDAADLPEDLIFRVDYLGGDMPTFALNFSRPAGEIVAQYYNFLRLGRDGYRDVQQACAATARFLASEVAAMGPFELVYDGVGGLPAIAYTLKDPDNCRVLAVRPLGSRAHARMADRVLSAAAAPRADDRPTHPRSPRRQPRHGRHARRRHAPGARALRATPGLALARASRQLPSLRVGAWGARCTPSFSSSPTSRSSRCSSFSARLSRRSRLDRLLLAGIDRRMPARRARAGRRRVRARGRSLPDSRCRRDDLPRPFHLCDRPARRPAVRRRVTRGGLAAGDARPGHDNRRLRHCVRGQRDARARSGLRSRDSLGQQHDQRGHGRGDRCRGWRAL